MLEMKDRQLVLGSVDCMVITRSGARVPVFACSPVLALEMLVMGAGLAWKVVNDKMDR